MKSADSTIKRWVLTALLLLPCLAWAKGPTIYEKKDDFKGDTVYFTERLQPKLEGGAFFSMRYVYVNLLAFKPLPSPQYAIQFDAELQDWIFINAGESLVLKVDEETITLQGLGSANRREVSSLGVEEVALYAFPLATLKKLAAAKSIQFRVYGSKGQLTGTFTPKMMADLRNFAEQAPVLVGDPAMEAPAPVPQAGASTTNPVSNN
jgi:hypothetical protein